MNIPYLTDIPKEEREKRYNKCVKCETRKWYAKRLDFHFDWVDCPYDCPNDIEHYARKMDEVTERKCDTCYIAQNYNLEDDDSPCMNCEVGE